MFLLSKKILFVVILPLWLLITIAGFIYVFSPPHEKPRRVGILFYQNNPTTTGFLNGLVAGFAKQGYYQGKNLDLCVENMQNFSSEATFAILRKMGQKRVHLLITTGKDLTVTTAHIIKNKPIIYALVARPITHETIKTVINKEENIIGVSYFTPYDRTLELAKRVIPNLKKVALLTLEKTAWPDFDRLKEAAAKAEIELTLIETTLTNITGTILNLRGQTDAVYLPFDIRLIYRCDLVKKALLKAELPAVSNNLEYQSSCVLTYFAEPETIGDIASRMAVKIFHKARLEYLPVELSGVFKLTINQSLLRGLNIKVNEDVLSYANEII